MTASPGQGRRRGPAHQLPVLRAYQLLCDEGLVDLRRGRGAVVVGDNPGALAGVREAVRSLVSAATAAGMPQTEVVRLVEEYW